MLGFRPQLLVAKRKPQAYNQLERDLEDGAHNEKRYGSGDDNDNDDDDSYTSSGASSPYSSRASSGAYDVNPNNPHKARPLAPNRKSSRTHRRTPSKPSVSAYSYRNPRAFTRYFGLAIASTLLLFVWFLLHSSWDSIRNAELKLYKSPPPPPVWESFPFLKRYHGGIRTLVSRKDNVPEYPTQEDIDPELPQLRASETRPKQGGQRMQDYPTRLPSTRILTTAASATWTNTGLSRLAI